MDTLSQLRAGKLAGSRRLDLACGLEEFPREIFDLADTLEVLNLTGNKLSALPDDLHRLTKLSIIFCSENRFDHLPAVLGSCSQLRMVGFKSNQIETVEEGSLPPSLRWLILTDNRISHLPGSIGRCEPLQKLMLSGNRLSQLPESMAACVNLEMIRLAANQFENLPAWLPALPCLAWLALAGNPCAPMPDIDSLPMTMVNWSELELIKKLGEGASGIIHQGVWKTNSQDVAVKIFKGAMTSDGLPASELAASLTVGDHPHLMQILGRVTHHPEHAAGLVMTLINPEFTTLAGPPSLESCTRDVYDDALRLPVKLVLRLAQGLAAAAMHLHERRILHGDFYAHNVLWNSHGDCILGDFGAASFYAESNAKPLQRIEVRAFGYLLGELLDHLFEGEIGDSVVSSLRQLESQCCLLEAESRPLFSEIVATLQALE